MAFMLSPAHAKNSPAPHPIVKPASDFSSENAQPQPSQASRAFTIQETYQQQSQTPIEPASPGVVGLDLLIQTGSYPKVQAVIPGTPAQQRGVLPGDTLIAVNGVSTRGQDISTVDAMISDVPGEVVQLRLLRHGQLKQINLTVVSLSDLSRALQSSFSSQWAP